MCEAVYPDYAIMLVDDDESVLTISEFALGAGGMTNLILVNDSTTAIQVLNENNVGIVLLDLLMPHVSGMDLLPQINNKYPDIKVIVLTAMNDVETAVSSMKSGAFDYLTKPVTPDRLVTTVKRAMEHREIIEENERLKRVLFSYKSEKSTVFSKIITKSDAMKSIFSYVEAIASTSFPVLITGETGVGKELIAEAIHLACGRKGEFVAVNIAGVSDQMLDDTLFGHIKGAYTGADKDRRGLVTKAEKGTLFLDEIGDVGLESQKKLLRFLQERKFYPLGADNPEFGDVRIIAATNKDISSMQSEGIFRSDLFYRLQTHIIEIPPLRERVEDIPLLVEYFVHEASEILGKKKPTVRKELYDLLSTYRFPGNIRELQSMIFDAISVHKSGILSHDVFEKKIIGKGSASLNLKGKKVEFEKASENTDLAFPEDLPQLRDIENMLIEEALRRANGNQTVAAKMLNVSRKTLNNRVLKLRNS